ncbi:hypothetical protein AAC03nite_37830 [Alicyclobacillus acidoterrestris]|nr:hypothetical protein AAC03nite_37830 [Alicyclobacillus acidoterrestris]
MTHFRKRLGADMLNQVNEWIIMAARADERASDDDDDSQSPDHAGQDNSERPEVESDVPRQGKGREGVAGCDLRTRRHRVSDGSVAT